jgi:hypothetical protein
MVGMSLLNALEARDEGGMRDARRATRENGNH